MTKLSKRTIRRLIKEEIEAVLAAEIDREKDRMSGEEDLPTSLSDIYPEYREPWDKMDESSCGTHEGDKEELDEADPHVDAFDKTM